MRVRLDRQPPLSQRILLYFECLQEPCHYITLADVLQRPAEKVEQACWHLAARGRLQRVRDGVYTLPTMEGEAVEGKTLRLTWKPEGE